MSCVTQTYHINGATVGTKADSSGKKTNYMYIYVENYSGGKPVKLTSDLIGRNVSVSIIYMLDEDNKPADVSNLQNIQATIENINAPINQIWFQVPDTVSFDKTKNVSGYVAIGKPVAKPSSYNKYIIIGGVVLLVVIFIALILILMLRRK